ncbi:hypothetical protein NDN08_005746 [Rhodosorus marinus]|uniref:Uncharacterized protein n=1 Tax=Rhodosorus marinus TaxID=101924 RepID=A0AAV8V2G7_9RHOD|nr:hypothetical protein NDN08_005746 [Rhodosorus marinus]
MLCFVSTWDISRSLLSSCWKGKALHQNTSIRKTGRLPCIETNGKRRYSRSGNLASREMSTGSDPHPDANSRHEPFVDETYPGTATVRLRSVHERVEQLSQQDLSGSWDEVRRKLLWAGGLRDLPDAKPGAGYTGHSFNDYNHCDLTTMRDDEADNENEGKVEGMAWSNQLGPGIKIASLPELGGGGSWSTCMIGCNKDPPQDVAHVQFRSRIAFKLVWIPSKFTSFVLVDDAGNLLATGHPKGALPPLEERRTNFRVVQGSKYATAAADFVN